jgi:hypothetical protein
MTQLGFQRMALAGLPIVIATATAGCVPTAQLAFNDVEGGPTDASAAAKSDGTAGDSAGPETAPGEVVGEGGQSANGNDGAVAEAAIMSGDAEGSAEAASLDVEGGLDADAATLPEAGGAGERGLEAGSGNEAGGEAGAEAGTPQVTLTVVTRVFGSGAGSLASLPAGIKCQAPCSGSVTVAAGSAVTLSATGGPLVGWGPGTGCSGSTCVVKPTASVTLTVTLTGNNFMFVSSAVHNGALGGPTGGDTLCTNSASAAGLPGKYVAWLATSTATASSRLGAARGWLRTDGLPFADTVSDMANGRVFYPPRLDETGRLTNNRTVLTGAYQDGTAVFNQVTMTFENCANFASSSGAAFSYFAYGDPNGGSMGWSSTGFDVAYCSNAVPVYCFGTDLNAAATVTSVAGRLAFVSSGAFAANSGLSGADAICTGEAGAAHLPNAQSFKAMLATGTATAASRFDLTKAPWVRVDGVPLVSHAADLTGDGPLVAALSQNAVGTYVTSYFVVYTGAAAPGVIESATTTCQDWSSNASTDAAWIGEPTNSGSTWFGRVSGQPCSLAANVYCFEN